MSQIFVVFAGLFGAIGVAFAAIAAHGGATATLGSASQMLLFHAPVLLGVGLLGHTGNGAAGWVLPTGAGLILLGCALFAGDLTTRQYRGHALFPMAAPSGGTIMILGWVVIAVAGLLLLRR